MSHKRIFLSPPHMGEDELKFIQDAFHSNWIAPLGENVDEFENDIVQFTGSKHAVVLSSGTAAIHLGLIGLNVSPGDEVICSSFTFSASANPIVYLHSKPIFIDSEDGTWNISPDLLEEAINDRIKNGKKPKAIVVVHLYGMPAKIREIIDISQRYNIPILEDAAEALGSKIIRKMESISEVDSISNPGQSVGTFGKVGVLSFNGNKIITTSGGGALLSDDESIVNHARFLSTQARDPAPHYEHSHIGYNYRMSNVLAGIGRGQMKVLEYRIRRRREIFNIYRNELNEFEGISFLSEPDGYYSNRWLTTIILDPAKIGGLTREDLRIKLEEENIDSRPLWKPMHQQPVFKDYPFYGNGVSDRLFGNGLCLPSGSNLTENDIERIINTIRKLFYGK